MSMNLKPAIRYQLREYLVSCLVFWAINALLIGIGFLVLSLNLGSGDRSGYTYNGYGFACAIFFLVFGLILPRQAIRLCVQMGVSRRTTFLSLFLSALLPAVCLSLAGELLLSLAQFAADHTQFQLEFSDLFSMIYLKQGLPLTFLQHTASILFSAACMLACYSLGLFFTFLFWRLNKVGCIVAALAIPASLIGFPPLLAKAEEVFPPVSHSGRHLLSLAVGCNPAPSGRRSFVLPHRVAAHSPDQYPRRNAFQQVTSSAHTYHQKGDSLC